MKKGSVPKIKECIAYIESCGWHFTYYNKPWYVFESNGLAKTASGSREVSFTLFEIRHAKINGW